MNDDAWEEMRRAKEEEYFRRQNKEAIKRLSEKQPHEPAETDEERRFSLQHLWKVLGKIFIHGGK